MLLRLDKIRKQEGFTLIELMVVIAIIGILAAIAIPQFGFYRKRSCNSAAQNDLRNFTTAQEAFFVDNESYCPTVAVLTGSYGAYTSANVYVGISSADTTLYNMKSYHYSGDKTYEISGPGGSVGAL